LHFAGNCQLPGSVDPDAKVTVSLEQNYGDCLADTNNLVLPVLQDQHEKALHDLKEIPSREKKNAASRASKPAGEEEARPGIAAFRVTPEGFERLTSISSTVFRSWPPVQR
jgi:hypothetical protein